MEQETYNKIKEELAENELFLGEDEIDTILRIAQRAQVDSEHIGIRPQRCQDNPRELAFQQHWLRENKIRPGFNSGHGILQGLFIDYKDPFSSFSGKQVLEITPRDRQVVATVIQWLGSNVGFCFLEETLKDCGYVIRRVEQSKLVQDGSLQFKKIDPQPEKPDEKV